MPKNYTPLPWKKTFRKLPPHIEASLARWEGPNMVVACSKTIPLETFTGGAFRHLCIESAADIPEKWESLIPSPNVGPASYRNATPIERQIKSLPKVTRRIRGRAPNGKGLGFHSTSYERLVWFTRLVPPPMLRIAYMRAGPASQAGVRVQFRADDVLTRADETFAEQLKHCLNLLQENVGGVDLYAPDASELEYLRRSAEELGWTLVPTTEVEATLAGVTRKLTMRQPARRRVAQDRLAVIRSLNPSRVWLSNRGYVGYFMIEFAENLTVFENLEIDHALYVVREKPRDLGKLTRSELRERLGTNIERIRHAFGWEKRLERRVKEARGEPLDGLV